MTKENIKKLHKHFLKLSEGKFEELDFNVNYGEGGTTTLGDMPPARRELIISDAKENLKQIEDRNPWLVEKAKN